MHEDGLTGVDIVIPNWNGRKMLEICLPSLARQSSGDFDVIVVDNGSDDGSVQFLRSDFPWVQVVELPENLGFSAAVNRGIEAGRRPWVLLLNNDIEVDRHCLGHLRAAVDEDPDVAMIALKMVSYHDRTILDGAGDGVLRGGVGYRLGTLEPDSVRYGLKRAVFGACAGAALYRRSLFERIGCFDEDFFAYLEDVDLNLRAVRAGFSCVYLPEAVVYHIGSATTGSKINPTTVRLTTRNNIFVICKNYTFWMVVRFLPGMLIYHLFWFFFVIKKRQFSAYLSGIAEAIPEIMAMIRKGAGTGSRQIPVSLFCRKIIDSERQVVQSIMARRSGEGKSNALLRCYLAIFC